MTGKVVTVAARGGEEGGGVAGRPRASLEQTLSSFGQRYVQQGRHTCVCRATASTKVKGAASFVAYATLNGKAIDEQLNCKCK